jgi:GGDEF domain-containing protein
MDDRWVLIDQDTGLHVSWYFWLRVLDEVNRSARYGNPFGLLMLDIEGDGIPHRAVEEGASRLADAIRSTDIAGRLGSARAGVILMEQNAETAAAGVDRIIERLSARSALVWRSSLYCYPTDGAAISNLLTQGRAEGDRRQLPA